MTRSAPPRYESHLQHHTDTFVRFMSIGISLSPCYFHSPLAIFSNAFGYSSSKNEYKSNIDDASDTNCHWKLLICLKTHVNNNVWIFLYKGSIIKKSKRTCMKVEHSCRREIAQLMTNLFLVHWLGTITQKKIHKINWRGKKTEKNHIFFYFFIFI